MQIDVVYLIEILQVDNFDARQDFSHRSFHPMNVRAILQTQNKQV